MPSTRLRTSPQTLGILRPRVFTLLMFLLGSVGCGGPGPYSGALYPVKGQVLLADGTPLTGGLVQFIPKKGGLPASGDIKADGTFSLSRSRPTRGLLQANIRSVLSRAESYVPRRGKRPRSFRSPRSIVSTKGRRG